ncbi:MAG: ribonuclease III [Thermoanaerobaculia bacterium]|nr:ribonuclease III [Thermoanaerobaculia bacterium]
MPSSSGVLAGARRGTPMATQIEDLEAALGHRFVRRELLEAALTHRSYSNERGEGQNYERLEFLGDSVLGLVAAEWLYARLGDRPEGELAKLKSFLVSTGVLGRHAREIGVGELLRLGVGEDRSGGRQKRSILADAMEALFGAVFVDGGFAAARAVVVPVLEAAAEEHERIAKSDAKTVLQERAQAMGVGLPSYQLVGESGPDHQKRFLVDCWLAGRKIGSAEGSSKKQAEQRAALAALEALDQAGAAP